MLLTTSACSLDNHEFFKVEKKTLREIIKYIKESTKQMAHCNADKISSF